KTLRFVGSSEKNLMNTAPMTMHALILLTTSMTWVAAPAQSVPDSTAIPMVADVFVLGGSGMQQAQAIGLAQWQSMLHSSKLLKNDLSDHAGAGLPAALQHRGFL